MFTDGKYEIFMVFDLKMKEKNKRLAKSEEIFSLLKLCIADAILLSTCKICLCHEA